ncbi:MAG: phosphate-selective porin OprO/OprP [Polaribacter sp.]|jgi:phosphate-selective porin OprO/OprP
MKNLRYGFVLLGLIIGTQTAFSQSKLVSIYKNGIQIKAYKDSAKTQQIFLLKPEFRFQTRFESSGNPEGGEKFDANFMIRRARLKFSGFLYSPNVMYKVELSLSSNDLKSSSDFKEAGGSTKVILDAVVKWRFYKSKSGKQSLTLWAGQTKLPGNRQRLVSSQALQLVDRSQVNSIFNLDRDIGVHLHGQFQAGQVVIRPIFALSKGEGRNIISNNMGGFSYTGKLEILPFGLFTSKGDYFEVDLKREAKPKLSLAASATYNEGASREKQTGTFLIDTAGDYMANNLLTILGDVMFKYKGFSFLTEGGFKQVMLKTGQSLSVTDSTLVSVGGKSYQTGWGISAQAGYLFKHNIELAARFTRVVPDWSKSFTGLDEYTIGLSKYVVGHKLKVQTDVTLIDKFNDSDYTLRYRLQVEVAF